MGLIISMIGVLIFNATPVVWVLYCMNEILNHSADFLPTLLAGIAGGLVQMVAGGIVYLAGSAIDS